MNTIKIYTLPIAIVLLLCISTSQAQTKYLDSINELIKAAKTDTLRILQTVVKNERLKQINLDSAQVSAEKNLEAARAINFQNGELQILLNLSGIYTTKGNYQAAEEVLIIADSLANLMKDNKKLTNIYSAQGILYGTQGQYEKSNEYFKKQIQILEKSGDSNSLGRSYSNLAIGYQMQGDYAQTLFYQQKALRIQEAQNNEVSQAYLLMNMGNTFENLQDTLKAQKSFLKGIELSKKNEIKNVELYGYSNLASLFSTQNKWQKSFDYATLAADLAQKMGDESIEAASLAKAAEALLNLGKVDRAEKMANDALILAEKASQPLVIYQALANKGKILTKVNKFSKAVPVLERAINMLDNIENYNLNTSETYANLSICYENLGRYDNALSVFKISSKIKDSIKADENIKKTTELSLTYEFEKKEALAQAEQDKRDALSERTKMRQFYLILGLGILLLLGTGIALILFRNNKQKQKANLLLKRQKLKVESTLNELKTTQAQLIQSEKMASLGELTAGIAHEIQNPLNFVNNFAEVSSEMVDEIAFELKKEKISEANDILYDVKQNLKKITHHGKRADSIVKGMLQHSRTDVFEKQPTNLNALTDKFFKLAYHGIKAKNQNFSVNLVSDYDDTIGRVNIVAQDVGRVILNLITNAFYAVEEKSKRSNIPDYKPTVSISTKKINQTIEIKVADNGSGISESIKNKIFQPFFTTKPTGQGTGLGLSMSYDIIKSHNGELSMASEEGKGSEFKIIIPI